MAYGVRWFSEFDDIQNNVVYITEVLERDYSGSSTEVLSAGDPVNITQEKVDNPYTVIRSQKAVVNWISDDVSGFEISDLFISDDRKYQLHISKYDENGNKVPLWLGYLVPIDCEAPYASKPFPVTFSATCGLPFLDDVEILTPFGNYIRGELSLMQIIADCLSGTGYEHPIHTYLDLFEESMVKGAQSALQLAEIDADGLRGSKGSDVINGILSVFGCFIVKIADTWVIQGVREQQSETATLRKYSSNGTFVGSEIVNRVATFGREHELGATPLFRGLGDEVYERIAEPNAIVTETVSPGNPVNRLTNGEFAGIVSGGNIPGWSNHITGGTSWSRAGFGRPEDPYRLEYYSFVIPNIKAKKKAFRPYSYFESNIIELNLGDFNIKPEDRKGVKIKLSGKVRANNVMGYSMNLSINEQERDYASFLTADGEWFYSKKEDRNIDTRSNQEKVGPAKTYTELEYQTFSIESRDITNMLNRSGQGIVRMRLKVFPGVIFPDRASSPMFLSFEDLAITISTDLVFEGDHKYRADGKLPIRNANEVEFTTIVADKIGIDTPEQSRDINRVMTGYMTLTNTNTLTKAWRRISVPGDGPEPIQKKSLRDRIRLLCGKRQVIEGSFIGYGLRPDHTIVNTFNPGTLYSVTSWAWDLKNSVFDATFHELNFTPLAVEDIFLYDEASGRSSGRGGSSGGGSGTLQPTKPIEQLVLDDPEIQEYEILVEDEEERVCDIIPLIQSSHNANLLEARLIGYPQWISEISIYRGEDLPEEDIPDEGILEVRWQGKPEKSGDYQILVELVASDGADYILSIPLVVEPSEDFIESWPPKFVDVPPLYFIAGKTATRELDLTEYLDPEGEHDGTGLSPRLLSTPYWVSDSRIVFMGLSVTGLPDKPGTYWVTYEISDIIGRTTTVAFQVIVLDPSFMTYELLDTSGVTPVVIGNLPGVYELPDKWDVAVRVKGDHDKYHIFLKGGGANADVVNQDIQQLVPENNDGNYRFFEEDNGVVTEAGQFSLSSDTYLTNNFIFGETIDFVLYDQEFLDAIKFFLTQGATVLGEIVQDGTSSFIDPVEGNFGIEIEGIEHDKAVIEFDLVTPVEVEHTTPEVDLTYTFADEDFSISVGQHTVTITLYLDDVKVATRYAKFETVADKPKPVAGLKLVSMIPNTTDYAVIDELPEIGGSFDLPANWNVLSDAESPAYDYEKAELWELRGGGLVEINVTAYTRQPDYNTFVAPVTKSEFFIFRELSSVKIGDVHSTPSTFRVLFTRRIGGATGQIVAILKSDFSFGDAVDIEDTPIKQPGADVVDVVAGAAMSESVVSFIKTLNVRVDNDTIEIFNPATPTQNWLRIKDKGVTLAKLADMTGPGLLGKATVGSGAVSIVPIVSTLVGASNSTIPTSLAVKDAIEAGTTWQAVMVKGNTSDIAPVVKVGAATTSANYAVFQPTDFGVGKPSLSIVKSSQVDRWNIALWDGATFNGTINFNAQNLTQNEVKVVLETRQVIAGTGLSGGGPLSIDRTFSVLYGTTAGTASEGNHVHAVATTTVAGFMSAADKIKLNNIATGGDTWGAVMIRGASSTIKPVVSIGSAITSADYLTLQPTDYGTGKPAFNISKSSIQDKWNVSVYDGVNYNGTLNFYVQNLSQNDVKVVLENRQVIAGPGLSGGGPLSTDRTLAVVFGTTAGTVSQGNHVHAVVTTSVDGFMSAADKVKLNNLPSTADTWQTVMQRGAVSSIAPTVSVGSAATSSNYLIFQPTDYGVGKPGLSLQKSSQVDKWNWVVWDGSSNNGVLNFAVSALTHNDVRLVREDRQINTGTGLNGGGPLDTNRTISVNFGTTGGTVAEGNHTHVAAQITDFVSVSRNAISGVGNISYNSATGVISYTGGSGSGTVGGSGTAGYFTKWSTGGVNIQDTTVRDTGTEIEFASNRSVGVLGIMAVRNDFNVWKDMALGHTNSHGTLFIHNDSTATINSKAALEIRSTTKVFFPSRMTLTQLNALGDVPEGAIAYAASVLGSTAGFLYLRKRLTDGSVVWTNIETIVT